MALEEENTTKTNKIGIITELQRSAFNIDTVSHSPTPPPPPPFILPLESEGHHRIETFTRARCL